MSDFTLVDRVTNSIQDGVLVINLPLEQTSTYTVETVVTISKLGENFLNLAGNDGTVKVWRDEELLFEGDVRTKNVPTALGEGFFKPEYQVSLPPFQGDYKVSIEYSPTKDKRSIFLWITDQAKRVQQVEYRSTWDYTEPATYRFTIKGPEDSDGWIYPGEMLAPQFPNEPSVNDWTYGNGLMLEAMWRASEQFQSLNYQAFVKRHLAFFAREVNNLESAEVSTIRPPFYQYFRYQGLDDYGLQTTPFVNFQSEETYKSFVSKGLNHVMYKSARTSEGLFARITPDSLTVWAEDLYFGTALLCKAYETTRSRKYLEEAVKQVILFNTKLKDKYSGLYRDGFSTVSEEYSSTKHAEVNGLVMLAKVELLKRLPESHPERESVLKMFRDHADVVRQFQTLDGYWNQIVNEKDSYPEISATAMFVTAFAEGVANEWLYNKEEFRKSAISGWLSVVSSVNETGEINDSLSGVAVANSAEEQSTLKTKSNNLINSASVLLAALAMDKLN